jgi:hypothetical protein
MAWQGFRSLALSIGGMLPFSRVSAAHVEFVSKQLSANAAARVDLYAATNRSLVPTTTGSICAEGHAEAMLRFLAAKRSPQCPFCSLLEGVSLSHSSCVSRGYPEFHDELSEGLGGPGVVKAAGMREPQAVSEPLSRTGA